MKDAAINSDCTVAMTQVCLFNKMSSLFLDNYVEGGFFNAKLPRRLRR